MKAEFICVGEVRSLEEIKLELDTSKKCEKIIKKRDWVVHIKHSDCKIFIRINYEDLKEIWNQAYKEVKRKSKADYEEKAFKGRL